MCDKPRQTLMQQRENWDRVDPEPPKTAEQLLQEKRERDKKHNGIEFLDDYMR